MLNSAVDFDGCPPITVTLNTFDLHPASSFSSSLSFSSSFPSSFSSSSSFASPSSSSPSSSSCASASLSSASLLLVLSLHDCSGAEQRTGTKLLHANNIDEILDFGAVIIPCIGFRFFVLPICRVLFLVSSVYCLFLLYLISVHPHFIYLFDAAAWLSLFVSPCQKMRGRQNPLLSVYVCFLSLSSFPSCSSSGRFRGFQFVFAFLLLCFSIFFPSVFVFPLLCACLCWSFSFVGNPSDPFRMLKYALLFTRIIPVALEEEQTLPSSSSLSSSSFLSSPPHTLSWYRSHPHQIVEDLRRFTATGALRERR